MGGKVSCGVKMPATFEEITLIRQLYHAAAHAPEGEGDALWRAFLAQFAAFTGADAVQLRVQAGDNGRADVQLDLSHGAALEFDTLRLAEMRRDRVYSQVDFPGGGLSAAALRGLRVPMSDGGVVWLIITRISGDFRAADGALLAALGAHLGQSADIWCALQIVRLQAVRTAAQARALGAGWLVLDRSGRVIEAAPWISDLLAGQGAMRVMDDGQVKLAGPGVLRALRSAIEALLAGQRDVAIVDLGADGTPTLALTRGHGEDLIGHIRRIPSAVALPDGALRHALGLSRSEARLAALICDGLSLRQASTKLGWTIETARSTSKQIYARTGTSGQADLVRTILANPVWLT